MTAHLFQENGEEGAYDADFLEKLDQLPYFQNFGKETEIAKAENPPETDESCKEEEEINE